MFTGLIETTGIISGLRFFGGGAELRVRPDVAGFDVDIGGSVAVDGVCLTLEKRGSGGEMFFTAVAETLRRTTFGRASIIGRRVNLERAMRLDGRLDGHIVLGHVDAVGEIVADERAGASLVRTVRVPAELSPFIAEKGSVAVDGISLTIAGAGADTVSLSLIPATIGRTTMSEKRPGDAVNVECDVVARYIYRMMNHAAGGKNGGLAGGAGMLDATGGTGESLVDKMERLGF